MEGRANVAGELTADRSTKKGIPASSAKVALSGGKTPKRSGVKENPLRGRNPKVNIVNQKASPHVKGGKDDFS